MAGEDVGMERREAVAALVRQARARAGLSVVAAVAKSAEDPTTKVGRTKWTQIEAGDEPLPSRAVLGKVAKVLDLDVALLLHAAGYEEPVVSMTTTGQVDVTQLVAELGAELRAIREAIERLSPPGRSA